MKKPTRYFSLLSILCFTILIFWGCEKEVVTPTVEEPDVTNTSENISVGWELFDSDWPATTDMQILDDGNAMVTLKNKQLYRSTDSCKTWDIIGPQSIDAYTFTDDKTGYLLRVDEANDTKTHETITIWKTTDAGNSFKVVQSIDSSVLLDFYANSDSVYLDVMKFDSNFAATTLHYAFNPKFDGYSINSSSFQGPRVDFKIGETSYTFKTKENILKIYRYLASGITDSAVFPCRFLKNDMRNFHFINDHIMYYLNSGKVSKYDFDTKISSVVKEAPYFDSHQWLYIINDTNYLTSFWTSESYSVLNTTSNTFATILKYDFRLKRDWPSNGIQHDIISLEPVFNNTYLYMFVNDGKIWRKRL